MCVVQNPTVIKPARGCYFIYQLPAPAQNIPVEIPIPERQVPHGGVHPAIPNDIEQGNTNLHISITYRVTCRLILDDLGEVIMKMRIPHTERGKDIFIGEFPQRLP